MNKLAAVSLFVFLMGASSSLMGASPSIADEVCVGPACVGVGERHRDRVEERVERRQHCRETTVRENGESRTTRTCED